MEPRRKADPDIRNSAVVAECFSSRESSLIARQSPGGRVPATLRTRLPIEALGLTRLAKQVPRKNGVSYCSGLLAHLAHRLRIYRRAEMYFINALTLRASPAYDLSRLPRVPRCSSYLHAGLFPTRGAAVAFVAGTRSRRSTMRPGNVSRKPRPALFDRCLGTRR